MYLYLYTFPHSVNATWVLFDKITITNYMDCFVQIKLLFEHDV